MKAIETQNIRRNNVIKMSKYCYFLLLLCGSISAKELPRLASINPDSVTVGGISTGGAFASQFLVAYSSTVKGAGIFSAVTNYCFYFHNTDLTCKDFPENVNVEDLVAQTRVLEEFESIDPIENLKSAKIFTSHGTKDDVVNFGFENMTRNYYKLLGVPRENFFAINYLPASHAVMTNGRGTQCGTPNVPVRVEDCGLESIQVMFGHLYANMVGPGPFGQWKGKLEQFEQDPYFKEYSSEAENGYYFVPEACFDDSNECLLHVYFHGCTMSAEDLGTEFIEQSGLLEMADANNIVLILPQLKNDASIGNPRSCWNWNGYLGDFENANFGTKLASQMDGVYSMIQSVLAK